MAKKVENITIEDARILFRNFSGKTSPQNPRGDRGFSVVLDPAVVPQLQADGWNVKFLQPREEGDEQTPILNVAVRYGVVDPTVFMVQGKKKTLLDEDTIGILDSMDIISCDMIITPYTWTVQGKSGVKAYIKNLYVNCEEDVFAGKYDFD